MKRTITLFTALLSASLIVQSQPYLFGTNQSGNGKIIRYDVSGNRLEMVSAFENEGLHPKQFSPLTRIAAGIFYGITSSGGKFGNGVIFKLDSSSGKYSIVHDFGSEPTMRPIGQPVMAGDGVLYGAGFRDDSLQLNFIYSFDPSNGVFNIELNFDSLGIYSRDRLVVGPAGKLYGTGSSVPGNYDNSRIFSFNPDDKSFEVYSNTDNPTGTTSIWKLVNGHDGKLYGTATSVNFVHGGILSFDPVTRKVEVVKLLTGGIEGERAIELVVYNGKLYGTTEEGGINGSGVVFSYDLATRLYDTIASLPVDEFYPAHNFGTGLVIDNEGIIHGMDTHGLFALDPKLKIYTRQAMSTAPLSGQSIFVVNDTGVIAVKPGSGAYQLVKRLDAPNGLKPQFDLYKGSSGLLYGATTIGGLNNRGVLFSFDPSKSKVTRLDDFDPMFYGEISPIVEMENGNLYFLSTNSEEPYYADGSLVQYNRLNKKMELVKDFKKAGLVAKVASLVKGEDGLLYLIASNQYGIFQLFQYQTGDNSLKPLVNVSSAIHGFVYGRNKMLYAVSDYGLVSYSVTLNKFEFFPYKNAGGLSIDSTGNLLFQVGGLSPKIVRFDVVSHKFSDVIQASQFRYLSRFVSKDSTMFFSYVEDLEDHDPHVASYLSDIIFSFKESEGIYRVLTNLPGDLYFKASVFYAQPLPTSYGAVSIFDTTVNEADQQAVLRIHLSKPLDHTLRLFFRTRTGSATPYKPHRDFIRGKGMIYIKKGAVDKYIRITVLQDELKEPDEKFYIQLLKTPHTKDSIQIEREQATITIMNGENPLSATQVKSDSSVIHPGVVRQQLAESFSFDVSASPNPSGDAFRISVRGNLSSVRLMVTNALGAVIEQVDGLSTGKPLLIGANWKPGVYFANFRQGDQVRMIKLVKTHH